MTHHFLCEKIGGATPFFKRFGENTGGATPFFKRFDENIGGTTLFSRDDFSSPCGR
jgi:hypothetical protein